LNSIQGEAGFAKVLETMGAEAEYSPADPFSAGSITVRSKGKLRGVDMDMDLMSDTGMTLAVTALFAEGPTAIRNIGNWRVKETDRIAAMAAELRKLGAEVEEGADFLVIRPPSVLRPDVEIDTYDDHRMAMCFSLVCVGPKGVPVTIRNPDCVKKTYPGYFTDFKRLAGI
jgi:3-phosphoshikimate 1-carboxyvinyltransferase